MKTIGWNAIKRPALLALALCAALAVARPALAAGWSVAADLPVAGSLTAKSSGAPSITYNGTSVTGFTAAVSWGWLGLGYEDYTSALSGKLAGVSEKFNSTVNMYDLVVNLPIPIVDVVIGAGVGSSSSSDWKVGGFSLGSVYKTADLVGYFASLGIGIFPMVDLHLGYHVFSGTANPNANGSALGFPKTNLNGDMYSLGIKISL